MNAAKAVFLVLVLLVAAQAAYYYPRLPDTVASHFDGAGRPNGWSSKEGFFIVFAGVAVLVVGSFLLVPLLVRKVPTHLVNLPHRDYWLAPERRERTLQVFQDQMLWLADLTLLFLIYTFEVTIRCNLEPPPRLPDTFVWALIVFLVATALWLVSFVRRFYRLPAEVRGRSRSSE